MKTSVKIIALSALVSTMAFAETIATVNGTKITSEDVNKVLMEGTQGRFNTLPAEKQVELTKRVVDGMISQELVYADAKKSGVLKSKEYKTERDAVMQRIEKQLAAKVWEKKQFDKVKVSEKDVQAYYDSHKAEFVEKEKVHARHILVKTEKEATEIEGLLAGLKGEALKAKFIELAKERSTGPSGPKGGDLGYFPQGQMVPEFNSAVFSMQVGTITPKAVKTQFGYHVIYLEDKKAGKTLGYAEVKSFIEQRLKLEKFKKQMEAKMESLKKSAKISYSKK